MVLKVCICKTRAWSRVHPDGWPVRECHIDPSAFHHVSQILQAKTNCRWAQTRCHDRALPMLMAAPAVLLRQCVLSLPQPGETATERSPNLRRNPRLAGGSRLLPSNRSAADPTRKSPVGDEVAPFSAARQSAKLATNAFISPRSFGCRCAALHGYTEKSIIFAKVFRPRVCSVCQYLILWQRAVRSQ